MSEEDYYEPYKLRIDDSDMDKAPGDSYDESYTEDIQTFGTNANTTSNDKTDHWVVESLSTSVTTPAGTFDCVQWHRTNSVTGSDKRYYFAPGIGKVKEEGSGVIEILVDYTVQ
jgi:hypothetical protein